MFYSLSYTLPQERPMLVTLDGYIAKELIERSVFWAFRRSYQPEECSHCFWALHHYTLYGFKGAFYMPDQCEPNERFRNEIMDFDLFRLLESEEYLKVAKEFKLTIEPISASDFCKALAHIDTIVQSYEDYFTRPEVHRRIHPAETPVSDFLDS